MAITQVGTTQTGAASNGDDVTLTFDVTPQENDVVVVDYALGDTGSGNLTTPSGYTALATQDTASESYSGGVYVKRMGASPDSSVTLSGTGGGTDSCAGQSWVLRGVSQSQIEDATTVKTGPNTTSNPDLDSITTVTDGAWVFPFVVADTADSDVTIPTGYQDEAHILGVDTNRCGATGCRKEVATAGAEDPGAYSGYISSNGWTGFTVAIRPSGGEAAELLSASLLSATTLSDVYDPPRTLTNKVLGSRTG